MHLAKQESQEKTRGKDGVRGIIRTQGLDKISPLYSLTQDATSERKWEKKKRQVQIYENNFVLSATPPRDRRSWRLVVTKSPSESTREPLAEASRKPNCKSLRSGPSICLRIASNHTVSMKRQITAPRIALTESKSQKKNPSGSSGWTAVGLEAGSGAGSSFGVLCCSRQRLGKL